MQQKGRSNPAVSFRKSLDAKCREPGIYWFARLVRSHGSIGRVQPGMITQVELDKSDSRAVLLVEEK
jgi:hypothetical protein